MPDPPSSKPRLDKLGVKPGHRVAVLDLPDPAFLAELTARGAELGLLRPGLHLAFLGAETPADLQRLAAVRQHLVKNGCIWVIFPKGRREMADVVVMAAAKAAQLVDNKVCAFSVTHTALRLVIPLALR